MKTDDSVGPVLVGTVGGKNPVLYYSEIFYALFTHPPGKKYCGRRSSNLNTAYLRFTTIPLAKTEVTNQISEKNLNSN